MIQEHHSAVALFLPVTWHLRLKSSFLHLPTGPSNHCHYPERHKTQLHQGRPESTSCLISLCLAVAMQAWHGLGPTTHCISAKTRTTASLLFQRCHLPGFMSVAHLQFNRLPKFASPFICIPCWNCCRTAANSLLLMATTRQCLNKGKGRC